MLTSALCRCNEQTAISKQQRCNKCKRYVKKCVNISCPFWVEEKHSMIRQITEPPMEINSFTCWVYTEHHILISENVSHVHWQPF